MSDTDVLRPYEGPLNLRPAPGPNSTAEERVAYFSDAAVKLAASFPQFESATVKGGNRLDPETQTNHDRYLQWHRANPPKPATVINLHPWPLTFGANNRFTRGITIPACEPGQRMAWHYIRVRKKDWRYTENGALDFMPIEPISLASEFVREFSNKDNDGGGVIIFEGESSPEKLDSSGALVETYDLLGRPNTVGVPGFEMDEENNRIPVTSQKPITRKLSEIIAEAIKLRNQVYFRKVQRADQDYKLPDGRGKGLITPKHFLMAEVLYSDGVIREMPDWKIPTVGESTDGETDQRMCKACGKQAPAGAYKCHCGNILNPFEAYMDGEITIDHPKMQLLTADEYDEVMAEEESRKTARAGGKKSSTKGKKAAEDGQAQ